MKHRIVFTGIWILFAAAVIVFPGFEVRGFAAGMIIGGWPAMISARIAQSQHHHPFILLLMMLILSGTTVGFLAWFLDKARMPKTIWIVLGLTIVLGAFVCDSQGLNYEQWQRTPSVSQAMESPEVNYQPSLWDFTKQIVIPRRLVGGLWGLYGIEAVSALCSVAILLKRYLKQGGQPRDAPCSPKKRG